MSISIVELLFHSAYFPSQGNAQGVKNVAMFIAHINGQPLAIKTSQGMCGIAFTSRTDGAAWLRPRLSAAQLDTSEEILRLNPAAFQSTFRLLHLSTPEAISQFSSNPQTFPTEQHLATVDRKLSLQIEKTSSGDKQQSEFGF